MIFSVEEKKKDQSLPSVRRRISSRRPDSSPALPQVGSTFHVMLQILLMLMLSYSYAYYLTKPNRPARYA